MGYIISGGVGLAVGLALLVWALHERSSRNAADRRADESERARLVADEIAENNVKIAEATLEDLHHELGASLKLQDEMNRLRDLLVRAGNPEAIEEWLDKEVGKEEDL